MPDRPTGFVAAKQGPGLLAVALITVLFWNGCDSGRDLEALRQAAARGVSMNHPLPAISLPQLDGDTVRLRDLLGERLTLINFWGTWCKPCEEEMPHLVAVNQEWGDRGVQVVGITVRSFDQRQIEEWVTRHGIRFPTLAGKSLDWMSRKFPFSPALPRTILVDSRTRMILHLWTGARTQADLERGIRQYWIDRGPERSS